MRKQIQYAHNVQSREALDTPKEGKGDEGGEEEERKGMVG